MSVMVLKAQTCLKQTSLSPKSRTDPAVKHVVIPGQQTMRSRLGQVLRRASCRFTWSREERLDKSMHRDGVINKEIGEMGSSPGVLWFGVQTLGVQCPLQVRVYFTSSRCQEEVEEG